MNCRKKQVEQIKCKECVLAANQTRMSELVGWVLFNGQLFLTQFLDDLLAFTKEV